MASSLSSKPPCPVCNKADQVKKLQAAYEAGVEQLAPPSVPTGTVSMLKYMVAAILLVGIGVFFIFVLIGSESTGEAANLVQVIITLVAIVVALVLSLMAFLRVVRGDTESQQYLPAYDRAMENYGRLYYCTRDKVVFDPQTNKTLTDTDLRSLLTIDKTPMEHPSSSSATLTHK
ncbi:MAG TPA: hypothetical protein VJ761_12040 [Ktedonobacteraceae bacterium]|nr:hypothetical protein [Ktedonobacteraceae bacterium]